MYDIDLTKQRTFIEKLTYDHDATLCAINYSLIVIGLLGAAFLARAPRAAPSYLLWTAIAVGAASVVQLVVLAINGVGVSGIWSAELGLMLWMLLKSGITRLWTQDRVLTAISAVYVAVLVVGVIHFAVTLPLMSTGAHLAAVVIGVGFCHFFGDKFVTNTHDE